MRGRNRDNVYWGAFILEWFNLLQDSIFTSTDYRVLFFLCSKMDLKTNKVFKKQIQIANDLNMDKGNISKSLKKLKEEQFITKIENGFMINPHLFYVGKGQKSDREFIRDEFDAFIENPRFYLDEDRGQLEDNRETH